ncbi:MAG: Rho termination factor N-terminal domain-containing protein [Solirubrobacteraceae bacterium]
MSVLDRAALQDSPLADLHEIASELSVDSYRRLRRAELIDVIIERQGGEPAADSPAPKPRRAPAAKPSAAKSSAAKSSEAKSSEAKSSADKPSAAKPSAGRSSAAAKPTAARAADADDDGDEDGEATRRRPRRRGGRGRSPEPAAERETSSDGEQPVAAPEPEEDGDEPIVEGIVELLPNGSGFVRVNPPDPSDDDVYVSAAQVKRCELVSGDRIAGPRRAPRRSERFASLIRIDTINGAPASELADGARFDELPSAFPHERFKLGSEDPTVKAIEWLTPIGLGSRVAIVGAARSGKSETLRRLAATLAEHEELQVSIVLAGVRPEEISLWDGEKVKPAAAVSMAASSDSQDHTVELVIDQARRIAGRGANAVVLIDTLDGMHPHAARRAMAAARNIVDGGSLTVIATSSQPLGGETTVIALDIKLTSTGRFPAIDLGGSGTIRPELLVGAAGAEAIASTRLAALDD